MAPRAPELLMGTRVPAEAMKTASVPFPANVTGLAVNYLAEPAVQRRGERESRGRAEAALIFQGDQGGLD